MTVGSTLQYMNENMEVYHSANGGDDIPTSEELLVNLEAIFESNLRIRQMNTSHISSSSSLPLPVGSFSTQELLAAIGSLSLKSCLNPSQLTALELAIQRPVSLIQGPPGTGKTKTACSILQTLVELKQNRLRVGGENAKVQYNISSLLIHLILFYCFSKKGLQSKKILACSHSNIATDNLLEGLVALGVNVVRLGRPTNVRSILWNHTLDGKLQNEPEWRTAKLALDEAFAFSRSYNSSFAIRNDMKDADGSLMPKNALLQEEERKKPFVSITDAKKELQRVETLCISRILLAAEIIVCSSIGAGSEVLKSFADKEKQQFHTVLLGILHYRALLIMV